MNISTIIDVIYEYIVKMIKDDEAIDIYDITEYQYEWDIKQCLFNRWDEHGGNDIITEYFGNQSIFEPTLEAFIIMMDYISDSYKEHFDSHLDYSNIIMGRNKHHTCCNLLRHYAYWYICDVSFENFKLKLKDYIEDKNDE